MSVLAPSQSLATLSRLLSRQIYLNFSYRVVGLCLWMLCGWRAWGWHFGQVGRGAPSIACPRGTTATGGRSFCSGWAGSMGSSRQHRCSSAEAVISPLAMSLLPRVSPGRGWLLPGSRSVLPKLMLPEEHQPLISGRTRRRK